MLKVYQDTYFFCSSIHIFIWILLTVSLSGFLQSYPHLDSFGYLYVLDTCHRAVLDYLATLTGIMLLSIVTSIVTSERGAYAPQLTSILTSYLSSVLNLYPARNLIHFLSS